MISEDFLHYLWRFQMLQSPLFCVTGESVMIIHPGAYNRDGGPDFINAKIQIGRTLWAGNVEIHLRASDWFRHEHQSDPAYNNVILHVVDTCDRDVMGAGNQPIPCLEVCRNYPTALTSTYKTLLLEKQWIPCQNLLAETDPSIFRLWAPALAFERLDSRIISLRAWMDHSENRWDEIAYQVLSSAMGLKINAQPFELLARSTPLRILQRHRDHIPIIEALLFGQAGLLSPSYKESYPAELYRSYLFYRDKYSLKPLEQGTWKFLRLRPVNFPTIRISQLADIIHHIDNFQDNMQENRLIKDWFNILGATASTYWDSHYIFERESVSRTKRLGESAIYLLLINGIIPLLFLYGTEKGNKHFIERTLSWLEEIPGEKNSMISTWSTLGMPSDHALYTQALKQLKQAYCDKKRCLQCRIGGSILKLRIRN